MSDLILDMQALTKKLNTAVLSLRKTGTEFAEAERAYKILFRKEALKLRDGGMPVTLIDKIVYGIPEVADARFDRDVKEASYKANLEAINVYKLQVRILDNQIAREWGTPQST